MEFATLLGEVEANEARCKFETVTAPTWPQLTARNTAATDLNLSGSLHVVGETDKGFVDDHFEFRYGRGDRWWVERNGEIVYASSSSTDTAPVARIDGQMVHQRTTSLIRLGALFTPRDLCGPRSLLTRRVPAQYVTQGPTAVDHAGRPAWSTELTSPTGLTTTMIIDGGTGLIASLSSRDHSKSLHLEKLTEHAELPDDQFVWDGSTIDSSELKSLRMSW
ncbi:hypothetical protein ASH04_05625 [Rhodococcus sp. Leaf233]|nr:hypothetical protein ASH04_05625 [Rhodococcus sp. Leaf233]